MTCAGEGKEPCHERIASEDDVPDTTTEGNGTGNEAHLPTRPARRKQPRPRRQISPDRSGRLRNAPSPWLLVITWLRLPWGQSAWILGVRPLRQLARDFRVGFAGFIAASIPIYSSKWTAAQFVPAEHPVMDVLQSHSSPTMLPATAITAVIVAPVTEEFFFRVVLQGWLEARFAERDLEATVAG